MDYLLKYPSGLIPFFILTPTNYLSRTIIGKMDYIIISFLQEY